MGLELFGDKSNQRGVEGPCLGRLVGDGGALCSVKGFCDGVQIKAPVSDFLKKVCGKNRLGDTPRRYDAAELSMAEGTSCIISCTMICQEPWKKCRMWANRLRRPAVNGVGVPVKLCGVPEVLDCRWRYRGTVAGGAGGVGCDGLCLKDVLVGVVGAVVGSGGGGGGGKAWLAEGEEVCAWCEVPGDGV